MGTKEKTENQGEVILVNNLYSGSYINDRIGGEVINLYQSDNGEFYVYVSPYGNIPKKWGKKIKSILFTRSVEGGAKVIAKAEGLELADGATGKFPDNKENLKLDENGNTIHTIDSKQKAYIKTNNITYGNVPLNQLGSWSPYFVTFRADSIHFAKKDIYLLNPISDDSASSNLSNDRKALSIKMPNKVSNQSMKLYVKKEDVKQKNCFDKLEKLINQSDYWDKDVQAVDFTQDKRSPTILSVVRKEFDELAVSNLLAYFLENVQCFWEAFAKDVLNLKRDKYAGSRKRTIIRESFHNIDILIELDNTVIVIENKIKSGINGRKENGYSQLEKYYTAVTNKPSAPKDNPYFEKENKYFFLLRPNYNNEDYSTYNYGENFKEIKYSKIEKIVENLKKENSCKECNPHAATKDVEIEIACLWRELECICKKHAKDFDNDLYETVNERFIQQIKAKKAIIDNQ